jgi:hypothetical protein
MYEASGPQDLRVALLALPVPVASTLSNMHNRG